MRYVTKKCPYCKKTYEQEVASTFVNGRKYGCPLMTCAKCGKQFWDDEYYEIAVSGIHKADTQKLHVGNILFSIILLLFSLFIFFFNSDKSAFLYVVCSAFISLAIFLPIFDVCMYKRRMKLLEAEAIKSHKRLCNPKYAQLLKEEGYPVPEKYLKN